MASLSEFGWKTILTDIQNNVERACHRQDVSTGQSWEAALAQVKALAAVPTGTFPPESHCPIFRHAAKTHTDMEDGRWASYQFSKPQVGHLRNHMIRLYQVLLVTLMAEEFKPEVDPPSEMLLIFRKMMESGLKDCAFYLKAPKTEDDRIAHNKVRTFASLLTQWYNIEEGKKPDALEILKIFLNADFKGFFPRESVCRLPDELLEEVLSELEAMSTISGSAAETGSSSETAPNTSTPSNVDPSNS